MEHHIWEAKRALYRQSAEAALHEVRKITALGFACMEYQGCPAREMK